MTFSTLASPGVSLQGGGGSGSGGGGGGAPGGSNTQIQYNSSGTFAGASGLTTNGTELTIASGTKTADAPGLNMSQTWNNGAVTFTGLKFNAATGSSAGSAAASLLMDLQLEGVSQAYIQKSGTSFFGAIRTSPIYGYSDTVSARTDATANRNLAFTGISLQLRTGGHFGFTSGDAAGTPDLFLTRRAAANLRLGAADAAAPVAQTLSVQSVVAGTSNTAGANLTITGSQGTGTGAGGSIVFQVAPAGSSGTAQNALATALTITADGGYTIRHSGSFWTSDANAFVLGSGTGTNRALISRTDFSLIPSAAYLGWGDLSSFSSDTRLYRDTTGILALRNGTSPQTFRVYNTTDGTNSEYAEYSWSGNVAYLLTDKTGTGTRRKIYVGGVGVRLDPTPASGGTIEILAANISTDTTTGMKIGTATTQKLGFYNKTPVVQPTAVADATDAATAITQLNALLSRMRDLGLIAT